MRVRVVILPMVLALVVLPQALATSPAASAPATRPTQNRPRPFLGGFLQETRVIYPVQHEGWEARGEQLYDGRTGLFGVCANGQASHCRIQRSSRCSRHCAPAAPRGANVSSETQ